MTKILKLVNDCAADCPHSAYERNGYVCRRVLERGPWRNEHMTRLRRIPITWTAPGKPAAPIPAWCPLPDLPHGVEGTFACPICAKATPHRHTEDEVQAARLMAMPEAEVDAELRRLGIDPDEAARQGKAAVEAALETIRARNAGMGGTDGR